MGGPKQGAVIGPLNSCCPLHPNIVQDILALGLGFTFLNHEFIGRSNIGNDLLGKTGCSIHEGSS